MSSETTAEPIPPLAPATNTQMERRLRVMRPRSHRHTALRHFPDKRDVLAAGQDAVARPLCEGIVAAPDNATPLTAVCSGLKSVAAALTSFNRELAPKLKAVIAASTELQERNAFNQIGLTAELGALAFKTAYARWAEPGEDEDLNTIACAALRELHATAADLG